MSDQELVDIIAKHVIPILPDVTQIPSADWAGWGRAIDALAEAHNIDPNNPGLVAETTAKCQTTLQRLLHAAIASNQQQGQDQAVPGADQQIVQLPVDAQQAAAMVPATEAQITASELQLTQLVGSAAEQPVLLQQPKAHIIARAKLPRGERLEIWYQLAFEGYPESDAEWFPANRIRSEYPNGNELIQHFERGLEETGQQDADMPEGAMGTAAMPPSAEGQLPAPVPLAVGTHADEAATASMGDAASMQMQMQYVDAVGSKRPREDGEADDDASKRQRAEQDAAAAAAAAAGSINPSAADQAAAADAATSAGMAAQLAAGGQVFAIGADGQPMLQVVPLQVDSQLGQMGQLAGVDLSQFAGMDPQMLQALSLQGMQMGNMGQLVLHVPGGPAGSHPMLTAAGLQLAGMPGLGMAPAPGHHTPGREAVIAHVKEAIKLLMHSSEELQRKKRQQSRRSELNQRRALLLPDGSAAPGALPTTAAGTPAPPAVRPTNMLAAIQGLPPAEKRNMLIGALRRALPIMMQTAQAGHTHDYGTSSGLVSRQSQDSAAMAAAVEHDAAMLQYQQLLAAGGQPGMQIIAVPLQNGMQGLMQVPLTAEQLQSMSQGGAITLDANGQLQLPAGMMMADPNAMAAAAAAAANPGMLASMGMLTAEQMQQLGLQAGDAAAAALDPAALAAAAAAAGMAMPGQDLAGADGVQLSADATAAILAAQDPNAAATAAMAAAASAGGAIQYDPAAMAAAMAAAAAAGADAGALHAPDGSGVQDGSVTSGTDPAAAQAAVDAAAAVAAGVAGYAVPDAAAADQQSADGAAAAAAPAADGAAAVAGGGKQDDAILAAISLTNLSRMPGPDEEGGEGAPADPAVAAATSAAAAAVEPSQQLATSEVMHAAAPVAAIPVTAAQLEQHVAAAAELAMQQPAPALHGLMDQQQQGHFLQQDHVQLQLQDHLGDGKQYVQLPAHLAGMQQVLEGMNPELLNPALATQDFTAAGMQ